MTLVRQLLDHDLHPRTLWRDRNILGPIVGLLMVGVVLRDLARRLSRPTPRSR
jgi:hypothetical protein